MPEDRWTPKRLMWTIIGIVSLILGAIGTVLPILPTTPFVILAAFAFGKSIPRVQRWLEESRAFGPAIKDWNANGAIAPKHKAMALTVMFLVLIASVVLQFSVTIILVQAACIGLAAAFILSRPNGTEQ